MKSLSVLVVIGAIIFISCHSKGESTQEISVMKSVSENATAYTNASKLIIPYGTYKGKNVDLVLDTPAKKLSIRIAGVSVVDEEITTFLKNEVTHLTKMPYARKIGNGYYAVIYEGGYPIWAPYGTSESIDKQYFSILFSEMAWIEGKALRIVGTDSPRRGWYPYDITL